VNKEGVKDSKEVSLYLEGVAGKNHKVTDRIPGYRADIRARNLMSRGSDHYTEVLD
jgi:hypothetical protein